VSAVKGLAAALLLAGPVLAEDLPKAIRLTAEMPEASPLPPMKPVVWDEGANKWQSMRDPALFHTVENASSYHAMAENPLALGLRGLGVTPLGARADAQEAVTRLFLPQSSARVLPEPWDLVSFDLWSGSPAGRLREAANRAGGDNEEALRLRSAYWETVNTAVRRRELFDRLEREALERGRGRD